jgi:hypothetical protein
MLGTDKPAHIFSPQLSPPRPSPAAWRDHQRLAERSDRRKSQRGAIDETASRFLND